MIVTQMVLDEGRIVSCSVTSLNGALADKFEQVEFDTPHRLLQAEGGVFKALVDGSGDKENLESMVVHREI